LGALFAAKLHAMLPSRVIIMGFSWIAALTTSLMVLAPAGVLLGALLAVTAFFVPVMVTTVMTYQLVVTPDELRGRTSSIVGLCAGGANVLGPMAGGLLVAAGDGGSGSLLLCAVGLAVVAAGTTLSPTLRRFPTVREEAGETGETA
ncbi:MAG TPA: MFS transporter, partial [Amycolatopsis sp.]|nr:MFS transporter [Amycolatopsis sp.]